VFPKDALKDLSGAVIQRELEITETVELLPPLTEEELQQLEAKLELSCPAHIRDMLLFSRGLGCGVFGKSLNFANVEVGAAISEISERGICLTDPEAASFFYIDITSDPDSWEKIFFVCKDPAVIALQSESLPDFLFNFVRQEIYPDQQMLLAATHPEIRKVADIYHASISREEAIARPDVLLSTFAEELEGEWHIDDLRYMGVGEGLALKRFGKHTELRRCGEQYIFASRENPNPPSLLKRMFGSK